MRHGHLEHSYDCPCGGSHLLHTFTYVQRSPLSSLAAPDATCASRGWQAQGAGDGRDVWATHISLAQDCKLIEANSCRPGRRRMGRSEGRKRRREEERRRGGG